MGKGIKKKSVVEKGKTGKWREGRGERERDQERQAILQIKSINRLGISAIEN